MDFKEEDLVLCVVKRIAGTTVFVKIADEEKEGIIITSEIAPGRIRNLRDYVIPGKKIVCKVLSIDKQGNINLSLRRVTDKEKRGVLEKEHREKDSLSILRSVLKEKAEEVTIKIRQKEKSLYEFLQLCKDTPKLLEKYFSKEETEKICKIITERKDKQVEVKKDFSLTSKESDGLKRIKKILLPYKESISYIAAGRFVIKIKAGDYKEANSKTQKILQDIEAKSKQENCDFNVKEK